MARMTIDCRSMPSESGCTLTISGEQDEVLRAAAAHAVDVHGHADDEELRSALRGALVESGALELEQGAFVQLIGFRTRRIEEFDEMEEAWTTEIGADRTARWAVTGADRNDPDRYVQIVGFPDHESAMANSKHPATTRFAQKLRELCEDDATFEDLDVRTVAVF
ncbi:DUF1059 domain-containing protein [Pseudonocardia sp. H11422]|uniref:DUF1059 domain-containing protein n=1 Tax=Pseudonocardia sp. H11422 TaxID=2835866 RepID=UPI001BDD0AE7|nr:DUF1059 domain-containing protein [Pseudonocardia sp. H11422]